MSHTPQQTASKLDTVARQLEQLNRTIDDIWANASPAVRAQLGRLEAIASFEGQHLAREVRALADQLDGETDQARAA